MESNRMIDIPAIFSPTYVTKEEVYHQIAELRGRILKSV